MSEPLSSCGLRFLLNSFLLASTTMNISRLTPEKHPYAFAACLAGGTAALLGLLRVIFGGVDSDDDFHVLRNVSRSLLEQMPLPLVNMELYIHHLGVCPLALAHGIFLLPLLLDLNCSIFKDRDDCDFSNTLRDLNILGNIVSLGFLGYVQEDYLYKRLAITMLVVRYMPMLLNNVHEETTEDILVGGNAVFFHLLGSLTFWQQS